ncbi:hypothetical protein CBR_g6384 [Chara braunii]|uniref:VTT domain-containing protein n=1 Tax=Chara braunii TaxID=69332 RepID=A0A388KJL6_CHABU|nr:hypothetical protein CBR_g6384 [Chara braunii]|eukprot:GBG70255.1 hypothetical protein CBR_g6384 [Chara braunii]
MALADSPGVRPLSTSFLVREGGRGREGRGAGGGEELAVLANGVSVTIGVEAGGGGGSAASPPSAVSWPGGAPRLSTTPPPVMAAGVRGGGVVADGGLGTSSAGLRILGEETTAVLKGGAVGVVVSPSALVPPGSATVAHSRYHSDFFPYHRETSGQQATTLAEGAGRVEGAAAMPLQLRMAASGGAEAGGGGGSRLTAVGSGGSAVDTAASARTDSAAAASPSAGSDGGGGGIRDGGTRAGEGVADRLLTAVGGGGLDHHLHSSTLEIEPSSTTSSRFTPGGLYGERGGGGLGGGLVLAGGGGLSGHPMSAPPPSASLTPRTSAPTSSSSLVATRVRWIRKLLLLAVIFSASLSMVAAILLNLPGVDSLYEDEDAGGGRGPRGGGGKGGAEFNTLVLKFPSSMDELKAVRATLARYQDKHRVRVEVGLVCLYVFCQTFMIPGTIFLNILAGSLYGFWKALILVTLSASAGSSCCYCLSHCLLKDIVAQWFPDKCEYLSREVQRHRHNLINYILFLRITPLLPNWFINMASPMVSVPFKDFYLGQAGHLLGALRSRYEVRFVQILVNVLSVKDSPIV